MTRAPRLTFPGINGGLQTTALFALDGLANLTDFAFHFWMGRALIPADFAVLQTLNTLVLIYVSVTAVFQPVLARFVAEAGAAGKADTIPYIFRTCLRAGLWLGLGLAGGLFVLSGPIGRALNLPVWTVQISAILVFLSTLRPVALGVLQGRERFIPFGLVRLLTAAGRLAAGYLLVTSGFGLGGAVIAFSVGWLAGVLAALLPLAGLFWEPGNPVPGLARRGWDLSVHALLAYLAFMSLAGLDLIWVNRELGGDQAGAYAGLVLLRRVVALLPGAAVTVMFPRIAACLAEGRLPDRLLANTAAVIFAACGALTAVFFLAAPSILANVFSPVYSKAAPLLGWMAFGMTGMAASSIWLNYYLAEKPAAFVSFLFVGVALETTLLISLPAGLGTGVLAFGVTGWSLALAGLVLYLVKSRPALAAAHRVGSHA